MFSEGKRINIDHTDIWKTMLELSSCVTGSGNVERKHIEFSDHLGIPVTSVENHFMELKCKNAKVTTREITVRRARGVVVEQL